MRTTASVSATGFAFLVVSILGPAMNASTRLGAQDDALKGEKKAEKKLDKSDGTAKKVTKGLEKAAEVPPELQAFVELAAPGPEHAMLERLAGKWDVQTKFTMAPDAPPAEGTGKSVGKAVLGGRYIQQTYKGGFLGLEFEGLGITGYDKVKKQFTNIWLDSMSTYAMTSSGTINDAGDTITFLSEEYFDPMRDGNAKLKWVLRFDGKDSYTTVFYDVTEPGTEVKSGEITYTRPAADGKAPRAAKAAKAAELEVAPKKAKPEKGE